MAKKRGKVLAKSKKKISQGLATLALILNIIFPGVGSLIGGKVKTGLFQLILMLAIIFLFPIRVGVLAWIAAIVWGIVTGVLLIKDSQ